MVNLTDHILSKAVGWLSLLIMLCFSYFYWSLKKLQLPTYLCTYFTYCIVFKTLTE